MKKNKNGIAMVVVLFFAFAIGIILFTMIRSNTNLSYQNKNTIKALQANYLAHSGMQHAKVHIRLLPREINAFFQANPTDSSVINYIKSNDFPPLSLGGWDNKKQKYDLFKVGSAKPLETPFGGYYKITSVECLNLNNDVRLIQDNYKVKVESEVILANEKFSDSITEEFSVSRYTGGR